MPSSTLIPPVITPVMPITATELAIQLRLIVDDGTAAQVYTGPEQVLLDNYIRAAYAEAESYAEVTFSAQNRRTTRADFSSCMPLSAPHIASITQVRYYDTDNAIQVLPAGDYELAQNPVNFIVPPAPGEFGVPVAQSGNFAALLDPDYIFPALAQRTDAVQVDFLTACPLQIKQATTLLAAYWFEHRESGVYGGNGEVKTIPHAFNWLVEGFKRYGVG